MIYKTMSFRGEQFQVVRGETHPEYSFATFEADEAAFRETYWHPKDGEVVVDVGASYGAYALTACAMGAAVFAFEPEPTVYKDLVRSIELNAWNNRIAPINMGLWSRTCKQSMKEYAPHWPQQTITEDYQMVTLDAALEGFGGVSRLDWLKIDVEGAEVHALLGAVSSIRRYRPRLIVEVHTFMNPDLMPEVKAILRALDYCTDDVPRDPCVMVLAKPHPR